MPQTTEILCLAGLTHELSEVVRSLPQADRDNYDYIVQRPLTSRRRINSAEAQWYIREVEKIVGGLGPQDNIAILVACIDLPGHSTNSFRKEFFPFGLSTTIPAELMNGYKGSGYNKRHAKKNVRARAQQVIRSVRPLQKVVNQVRAETEGYRKKIPLILPRKNFRSKVLLQELEHLSETLPNAADPIATLNAARQRIDRFHPEKSEKNSQYRSDDGDLQFVAPRRAQWHGHPHSGMEEHEPQCLLNNRSRLGGITIAGNFHFDCQDTNTRRMEFLNCHDENVSRPKKTYVNIGANDWIR